jgi:hypothetical protein
MALTASDPTEFLAFLNFVSILHFMNSGGKKFPVHACMFQVPIKLEEFHQKISTRIMAR